MLASKTPLPLEGVDFSETTQLNEMYVKSVDILISGVVSHLLEMEVSDDETLLLDI